MKRVRKAKWTEVLTRQAVRISGRKGPGGGRFLGRILAGICLVLTCALFAGWVHIQGITQRYSVARQIELRDRLTQTRDSLEIERQMLRSPQRLSRLAEQELGMVIPDVEHRVVIP